MTYQDIARLGPAFSSYLGHYRPRFLQGSTAGHFENYYRGLLAGLPRKTVEPIALVSGTAVRALQEFLVTASWDHELARDTLQRRLAGFPRHRPGRSARHHRGHRREQRRQAGRRGPRRPGAG